MKYIEVKYLPEAGADKSKFKHVREKCFTFPVPDKFIFGQRYGQLIQLENGLNLNYSFEYSCSKCGEKLEHYASGSNPNGGLGCSVWLRCDCGEWLGEGSPFSGNWYGSELKYTPYTKEQLREKMRQEIEIVKSKYKSNREL